MYTLISDFQEKILSFFTFFFDHFLRGLRIKDLLLKKDCKTVI
jgi:hypothetical protein